MAAGAFITRSRLFGTRLATIIQHPASVPQGRMPREGSVRNGRDQVVCAVVRFCQ
jgi:hypothetical protein